MKLVVRPTACISGEVTSPSSKSQSIRAIFLSLLSEGESILNNILDSDDIADAINICRLFEVDIAKENDEYILRSRGLPLSTQSLIINTGNSGISTHFIMPLLGLRKSVNKPVILTCNEQMRLRPVGPLVDALIALGLNIKYLNKDGYLPILVSKKLNGGKTEVAGITSQYLSALLLALPCARNDSEITVRDLRERPYLEMTIECLKEQGIQFVHHSERNMDRFTIKGRQIYKNFNKTITGDFSSASYLLAAAVMTQSNVAIYKLNMNDLQADKKLISILQEMGADIVVEAGQIIVKGGKPLKGMDIDASDMPDLLPTLAVIGSFAQGKTRIFNVPQARIKETDRIHSIAEGLTKMGCLVDTTPDGLTIHTSKLSGANVFGYGDHRTVMALCVAGLIAEGETTIDGAEAINKSYPNFIRAMKSLGADVEVENAIIQ
jgi:3-phosphoshikimate 1-carboxyvinyltransferase